MKKLFRIVALMLCLASVLGVNCMAEGSDYVIYEDNKTVLPQVYEYETTITGVASQFNRSFAAPNDVFIDSKGFIYIADSGNDRVVKLDSSGTLLMEISMFDDDYLINPTSVYVDESGRIFVTDTGNYRILVFDKDGKCLEKNGKPQSDLLSNLTIYMPDRVVYSEKTKYSYCIAGKQLLLMDPDNVFQGYCGAEPVDFSLKNFFIRRFGSKEQIDTLSQNESVSYSNICMFGGDLYAVTLGKENNIKVLNGIGVNTYPAGNYGEVIVDVEEKTVSDPVFCDIAVEPNGNILVAQANNNRIYAYDSDGNMLFSFGGTGKTAGQFSKISSIAVSADGRLYVLDSALNHLQVLRPTYFAERVYAGGTAYADGKYNEALDIWQNISTLCPGYLLAHEKIGNIMLKQKDYTAAAESYRTAKANGGYAEAYDKLRTAWIRDNIYIVVIALVILLALLYMGVVGYRRVYKKVEHSLYFEEQKSIKTFFKLYFVQLCHPVVCYDRIKANRSRIPLWVCLLAPAAVPLVCIFRIAAGNFAIVGKTLSDTSLVYEAAIILVPLALWIFISYLVTSLMSGEATLKETIAAGCYSLVPWVVFTPIVTLASHIAGSSDQVFFTIAEGILLALVIIELLVAMGTMNDYSFTKTLLVTLISLFGMIIVCFAILLFSSLAVQTVNQISDIIHELSTLE
ncbi:MAG: hypothetical protein II357_02685 [Clostridia bacterium]|nr:hypothetical protein [Clostridia bacterium]